MRNGCSLASSGEVACVMMVRMMAQRDGLPNFVIAGFSKCGTTTLFNLLATHPDVHAASTKETRYFQPVRYDEPLPPLDDYRRYFRGYDGQRVVMECTPDYVYGGADTATAIQDVCAPKVAVIVREPVARAHSFFRFLRSRLQLPAEMTFGDYVERCLDLPESAMHQRDYNAYTGVWGGRYADVLPAWFDVYGNDCRVFFFDDLVGHAAGLVSEVCDWLGIDVDGFRPDEVAADNASVAYRSPAVQRAAARLAKAARPVLHFHPGLAARARRAYAVMNETAAPPEPIDDAVRARLDDHYRPSLTRLRELLVARGVTDLPSWLVAVHR
jgi:hypothetical protein